MARSKAMKVSRHVMVSQRGCHLQREVEARLDDRMAAEKIKGLELYVSRDALPEPNEEEFYYSDLIGLDVEDEGGKLIGQVKMMDNYGAGEVMEVTLSSGEALLLPFTRKVVPVVDVAAGKIQIVRPNEVNPGQEEVVNDEGVRA